MDQNVSNPNHKLFDIKIKFVFIVLCYFCYTALVFAGNGISNLNPQSNQITHHTKSNIVITPPRKRTLNPNTFPMFVYTASNNSNVRRELAFSTLLPANWDILTFNPPSSIEPQTKERVRITIIVPKDACADRTYKIGLVTKWDFNSDTSYAEININPRPAFRLITFIEEKRILPGEIESLNYIIQNDGNITNTISLNARLPKGWELIELVDLIEVFPGGKVAVDLLFKAPKGTPPGTQDFITLTATSLTAREEGIDLIKKRTSQIFITHTAKMDVPKSLHPTLPINLGFSINRIEEERYPDMMIFANTEYTNWGNSNYRTKMELTQRSTSVPRDETPQITTDRVRFELTGHNISVVLGDIIVESSPLMTRTNPLARYQPLGGSARGGSVKYLFDKADISLMHGKGVFSNYTISSMAANYMAAENFELSSSYLRKRESHDESHLVNIEGLYDSKEDSSIGVSLGVSKSKKSEKPLNGSAQLYASTKHKDIELSGRLHWADNSYAGVDRGKYGVAIDSRWKPKPFFYLWGNLHSYNQNYFSLEGDSSAFVTDIKTRFMLHYIGWPVLNLGLNYSQKKYSTELTEELKHLDFQIQKYFKYGRPSFYFTFDNKYDPTIESESREYELRMDWNSSFKHARFKLEQRFLLQEVIHNNPSPWGNVSKIDMDYRFRGSLLGMYYSNGKIWKGHMNNDKTRFEYEDEYINDIGLRSNFRINIFGINYNIRLECGRNICKGENWNFLLSLSAGGESTFLLPVPILETKGRMHGEVFIDKNGNRIKDIDEPGVPQILIFFKYEDALTDGDGKFEFPAMEPGEYPFSIDLTSLSAQLSLARELPETISLREGSNICLLIPVSSNCSIKGHVFLDSNTNGKHDAGEKGFGFVRVVIKDVKGKEWEAYTDEDGYYEATDLLPGIYTVMIDSHWLPKRILPGKTDYTVVLSSDIPRKTRDLAAVKKRLQIKKTFIAPKK